MAAITTLRKGKAFWGEPNWDFIHYISYTYDPKDTLRRPAIRRFFILLPRLLPCKVCRTNLLAKYKALPPTKYMDSQKAFFYYTYVIHDMANKHINKYHPNDRPKVSPPFKEVLKKYASRKGDITTLAWHIIHIYAATLRYEDVAQFKEFLGIVGIIVGDHILRSSISEYMSMVDIDPYLLNNNDAFFYTYMAHQYFSKKTKRDLVDYDTVKSFYFRSLGEECNDCKV